MHLLELGRSQERGEFSGQASTNTTDVSHSKSTTSKESMEHVHKNIDVLVFPRRTLEKVVSSLPKGEAGVDSLDAIALPPHGCEW